MSSKKKKTAISPTREEDYSEWYQQVIKAADLAEHSCVRGCMVIKPWGFGIWENIQKILDDKIKETGHQNVYFPLFIPLSYFEKESEHVEGFAKECAVVTHHRLEKNEEGRLVPAGELDQPLVVRPTSEMIIGETFAKWVKSYRDLPILINQWANVVRWEMRTRLFLRTTEFLWQEGHTVHATEKEAIEEAEKMLDVYETFSREYLAIPVFKGKKTKNEKFPGAVDTYAIEAIMQDGKALQMGTSHFLGQNFSKSSNICFTDEKGDKEYGWTTSWGLTTRLIGGVIMTHSDDDGLVLPPRIAPSHIVILPVIHSEDAKEKVLKYCESLSDDLKKISYVNRKIQVVIDKRDIRGGEKKWSWVKKGIPLIIEIGLRDIDKDSLMIRKRVGDQKSQKREEFINTVIDQLEEIQKNLLQKATDFQKSHTKEIKTKEEFYSFFSSSEKKVSGFVICNWAGDEKIEKEIKDKLNVTARCLPFEFSKEQEQECIFTKIKTSQKAIFGKAY
jgi:prolyl-tRNA synthetase